VNASRFVRPDTLIGALVILIMTVLLPATDSGYGGLVLAQAQRPRTTTTVENLTAVGGGEVAVVQGASLEVELTGNNLEGIAAARIARRGRIASQVTVSLYGLLRGQTGVSARGATIQASSDAGPGTYDVEVQPSGARDWIRAGALEVEAAPAYVSDVNLGNLAIQQAPKRPGVTAIEMVSDFYPYPADVGAFGDVTRVLDSHLMMLDNNIANLVYVKVEDLEPDGEIYIRSSDGTDHVGIVQASSDRPGFVKVRFPSFASGRVGARNGDQASNSNLYVSRMGYHLIDASQLESLLSGFSLVLGDPIGAGTLSVAGESYHLILHASVTAGLHMNTNDMASNGFDVSIVRLADPNKIAIRLGIDFETQGYESTGQFIPTIWGWECGSFKVLESTCPTLNLSCFVGQLGAALQSSLLCMNTANWERKSYPGPAVPVNVDLANPRLELTITLGLSSNRESITGAGVSAELSISNATVHAVGVDVSHDALTQGIVDSANEQLGDWAESSTLDNQLADTLEALVFIWTDRVSRWTAIDNRLYFDFFAE